MAVLETLVYQVLRDHAGVSALVSGRVYPLMLPQGCALPAISYQRVSTDHVASMDGYSGLERVRVQIDVMASTYAGAKALATQVMSAMNSTLLFKCVPDSQIDMLENDESTYRVSIDFMVWNSP